VNNPELVFLGDLIGESIPNFRDGFLIDSPTGMAMSCIKSAGSRICLSRQWMDSYASGPIFNLAANRLTFWSGMTKRHFSSFSTVLTG
jgi:hypothetical protein